MDIIEKAESEARRLFKKDFKAIAIGTDGHYIIVSMTNSEITDGLDHPLYVFYKMTNMGKLVLYGDLLFEPIDDLELSNLSWEKA